MASTETTIIVSQARTIIETMQQGFATNRPLLSEGHRMRRFSIAFVVLGWICFPTSASFSASVKLVITFASLNERTVGAFLVAEDQGFFAKQDLDVKFVNVRSGPVALAALASGESQFQTGSSTGSTLGAIAGGLDAVFVAGLVNRLTGTFMVVPAIKIPAELKKKRLGVQSMGGGIWMNTMLTLDHWGLDPSREGISFRVIGDEAVLAQAIASGIIDGAYLSYTFASVLKRQGYRMLADLAKLNIPYQSTGLLARRNFVQSSPDVVEKLLRAVVEAIVFIQNPANKLAVMKSLAKGLRLQKVEETAEGYEVMRTLYEQRIYPNAAGIRNVIRLLGPTNAKIAHLRAEDVIDDRIVKKLEQEGLFK
jgi:ABC-type nitrate/sulfonate/bicarbonate transport system substrate-binding protein